MERLPSNATSAREREVLQALAADGATNAEVAARLFISVRTVESHVASLLRKTGVHDRRALVRLAPELLRDPAADGPTHVPLTSFIGRERERARVIEAVAASRLVSIVGAGGSGKTRLALSAIDELAAEHQERPVLVDLVPVSDPARVPAAIAGRLGLAERGSAETALAARFRDHDGLVLLDSCEHLGAALTEVLERLLAACPGLRLLATSRTRFAAPFETVVRLGGMEPDDAVELFALRCAAAGEALDVDDRRRAEAICGLLEGLPLALELAAAQVPAIGIDGVESALGDPLALLAGGARAVPRHGSVRATLEWSHDLLGAADRAVLRRLAVLDVPFPVEVAQAVAGDWAPVPPGSGRLLGALVDASLLAEERGPAGTRYRLHEVVRRFAAEQAVVSGEDGEAESRLLAWCSGRLAAVEGRVVSAPPSADVEVALMRCALERAAARRRGPDVFVAGMARRLAAVLFAGGVPADAERLFELAAATATTPVDAAGDLDDAAGAAETHGAGEQSVALRRAAAARWSAAGMPAAAADQLARAAELLNRAPGSFATFPEPGAPEELIAEARRLAPDDPRAAVRILTATAFADPTAVGIPLGREAAALARLVGDLAGESAALDAESGGELVAGRVARAYALDRRRIDLLAPLRSRPGIGLEYDDALQTCATCAVAVGDLRTARRLALEVTALPALAVERHLAEGLPMVVDAIRGELTAVIERAPGFHASWQRAGRPVIGAVSSAAYSAATAFALAGGDEQAGVWRSTSDALFGPRARLIDFERSTFDLLLLLHRGEWDGALQRAWSDPAAQGPVPIAQWIAALWRPWYAALWAEAAVLARSADADERLVVARRHVSENPVAVAMVDRAAAVHARDTAAVEEIATRLDQLDAPYQAARTRVLAGGPVAARGAAGIAACGAAPMVRPAWLGA